MITTYKIIFAQTSLGNISHLYIHEDIFGSKSNH